MVTSAGCGTRAAAEGCGNFPRAPFATIASMNRIAVTLALLATAGSAEWADLVGSKAPDFAVKEWFNKAEGKTLSDFRGKAVLLEFWATW